MEALQDGDGIYPEDLLAAEKGQGVHIEPGDVLVARTEYLIRALADRNADHYDGVGYHASTVPLLHERGVAVIASDALNDMNPSGICLRRAGHSRRVRATRRGDGQPHIPGPRDRPDAMGAWLLDHVEVEELAATCRRLQRWDFLITIEPLRMIGSTSSHVNPLAIF